jgi:outer membrane protein, adhesin transport system
MLGQQGRAEQGRVMRCVKAKGMRLQRRQGGLATAGLALMVSAAFPPMLHAQIEPSLPAPGGKPMAIDASNDPILALAQNVVPYETLRSAIAGVIAANPTVAVGRSDADEARAARREARTALFPVIDLGVSANRAIARQFSNDPNQIIERSRGRGRVDATASIQQTLFDFGAASRRIEAASSRLEAAGADADRTNEAVALRAIGAWYDIFAFGHLQRLGQVYLESERDLKSAVNMRIAQGVSAPVDRARVDSAIASAELRLGQYQRQLGNAQARYVELFKVLPDAGFRRAPPPMNALQSQDAVVHQVSSSPVVKAAKATAVAARAEAAAARADLYPNVAVGVDAGRYGLFVNGQSDYDIRARVSVRQRLFGPGPARASGAKARADSATARAVAVEDEAIREARIAWSDVEAMRAMLISYESNYLAARKTRDAVVERFRVSRGTLFDVLDAEDRFFDAAANYIQGLSEYDSARYVLLARSGQLLDALAIPMTDSNPTNQGRTHAAK